MSIPVDLNNREALITAAKVSLSSKVVSHNSDILAPMAADAVLRILPSQVNQYAVDLRDIKVCKKIGGTVDNSMLLDGVVFPSLHAATNAGGPTKVSNPKVGFIQFCLTAPKTDLENNVVVHD